MKTQLVALGLLLAASAAAWAETRTWLLKSGVTLEAELINFPDAGSANLRRLDGKIVRVPFASLSERDRTELAREQEKAAVDELAPKEWKKVSVDELLAAPSGYYSKCLVTGKARAIVVIQLLPPAALGALNARRLQTSEIHSLADKLFATLRAMEDTMGMGGISRGSFKEAEIASSKEKDPILKAWRMSSMTELTARLHDPLSLGGLPGLDEPLRAKTGVGLKSMYVRQTAGSVPSGSPRAQFPPDVMAQMEAQHEAAREIYTRLNKVKADYTENLKKNKEITTVEIKNTGAVLDGLMVCACKVPRKAQ
jgi:hypothetical protein